MVVVVGAVEDRLPSIDNEAVSAAKEARRQRTEHSAVPSCRGRVVLPLMIKWSS